MAKAHSNGRLSRAELEQIVDGLTARDIFSAAPDAQDVGSIRGGDTAAKVFDIAAQRLGYGELALDRVAAGDATYLAGLLGEALNVGGPKAEGTEESLTSPGTGG